MKKTILVAFLPFCFATPSSAAWWWRTPEEVAADERAAVEKKILEEEALKQELQDKAFDTCVDFLRDYSLKGSASICAKWLVAWNEDPVSGASVEGATVAENARTSCATLQVRHKLSGPVEDCVGWKLAGPDILFSPPEPDPSD